MLLRTILTVILIAGIHAIAFAQGGEISDGSGTVEIIAYVVSVALTILSSVLGVNLSKYAEKVSNIRKTAKTVFTNLDSAADEVEELLKEKNVDAAEIRKIKKKVKESGNSISDLID